MQARLSSKGQVVLPAPMRQALGLRARSRVSLEERDGRIFIRPAGPRQAIEPIGYLAAGTIRLSAHDYRLDGFAGEDDIPSP